MLVFAHSILTLSVAILAYIKGAQIIRMDDLGLFVFIITSVLYFAVALYRFGGEAHKELKAYRIHSMFLIIFVSAMTAVSLSRDLGLIWIFVEATTLASAMLITFDHNKSSLEAAWKYLFICSVGIALAFVGILMLVIAQNDPASLHLGVLMQKAPELSPFWVKMSFVFMLVGFGTKIGLAPLHFWLPDAHSEAPAPISALLSGALLNTALLPILRMGKLMRQCQLEHISNTVFQIIGLLSIFVATVFILKTKNFKRLLAYSSIENMGIILLAFGSGAFAHYAGYLHILGHSLIKAAFFLTAGNIISLYHSKYHKDVCGLLMKHTPSGWIWLIAFAMIIGIPPSPLFISEFMIAAALLKSGSYIQLCLLFGMLIIIAYGIGKISFKMCLGSDVSAQKLSPQKVIAPAWLLIMAAILGLWLPQF